jgi:hypothetical protein
LNFKLIENVMTLKTKKLTAAILTLLALTVSVAEAAREGPKGAQGHKGAPGVKGQRGVAGPTGVAGTPGPAGIAGTNGTNGTQGIQGTHAVDGNAVGDTLVWDGTDWMPTRTGFAYSMTCGTHNPKNEACKIGAVGPGGGWIFFVDKDDDYPGFNYLEAAPTDIALRTKWCFEDTTSIYPTVLTQSQLWAVNGVGYGAANTDAMLLVCSSGAAHDVHAYSSNGKNDWFLGSSGEFMLMYTNLRQAGVGGFEYLYDSPATAPIYWTSTEGASTSAVTQSFRTGQQGNSNKQFTSIVRPMRAF